MKITYLEIDGYKNLDIKLTHKSDIITIIGNNGSGKSNLLEAISYIFRSLYTGKSNIPFDYTIAYTNSTGQHIKIVKKRSKSTAFVNDVFTINIKDVLPKKVIAIYSGEEARLWEDCFFPFYTDYIKQINISNREGILQATSLMPQMLYLNKFYWHISLLSLLLSDLEDNKAFVKNILKIDTVDKISFTFNKKNYSQYANNLTLSFIQSIDKSNEYTLAEFKELMINEGYIPDDVYKFLYIAFSPKNIKIVTDIEIRFNDHLSVGDFSEGEKKLLLIKAAFEFAEQEDSLFILDEPDAHIHLNNKEQIIKTFEPYKNNRQIIVTTHSPTVTKAMYDDCLFMVDDGKIIPKEKQEMIDTLAGDFWNKHQQSTFLSSNKEIILLVEGKHDKIHLKNAFKKLKEDYENLDFDIFNMSGADNIEHFVKGLYCSEIKDDRLYISILDHDEKGIEVTAELKKALKGHTNFDVFMYPKKQVSNHKGAFTVENLFKPIHYETAFQAAFEEYSFEKKSIHEISENIQKRAKGRLTALSVEFDKEEFENFKHVFDKISNICKNAKIEKAKRIAKKLKESRETTNKLLPTTGSENTELPEQKNKSTVVETQEGEFSGFPPKKIKKVEENQQIFTFLGSRGTFNPKNESFTLLKGSEIRNSYRDAFTSFDREKREILVKELNSIIAKDKITINKNHTFNSPSGAARFVNGGNKNGWTAWKNEKGESLDDLYRKSK